MKVALKDPELGYVSNYLWLPKWSIGPEQLDAQLKFVVESYQRQVITVHTLWHSCGDHYRVPRQFPVPKGVRVVDLRPKTFEPLTFEERVTFQDERQKRAWESGLLPAHEGTIKLACGSGKTVLGIKKAVVNNGPFIVIFYDTGLMDQWEMEIRKFTTYDGPIGVIQGNRCDWNKPIVFASLRTLINRPLLPLEARTRFKTVLFDEAQHCPASLLKRALAIFWGDRIALSATPERADGMEKILYLHVGPIFYEDISQPLTPRVYFKASSSYVSLHNPNIRQRGYKGGVSIPRLISYLAKDESRNQMIVEEVLKARQHGRRVLVITNTLEHVRTLTRMIPESHALTGRVRQSDRHLIFKKYPVVVAIKQIGQEGLDAKDMDTVIFAFPTKRGENFDQIAGRAMRMMDGKNTPVIVIIDDAEIRPLHFMCRALQGQLSIRGQEYFIV